MRELLLLFQSNVLNTGDKILRIIQSSKREKETSRAEHLCAGVSSTSAFPAGLFALTDSSRWEEAGRRSLAVTFILHLFLVIFRAVGLRTLSVW